MIGIVLIGHARIASEMLTAVHYVVGEQALIESVDVGDNASPAMLSTMMQATIRTCDVGDGVLVLADMFGGTPCNVAMESLQAGHIEVISGFNLPLLIKAVTLRQHSSNVAELAQEVVNSGRQYIQMASSILPTKKRSLDDSAKHDGVHHE